MSDLSEYETAKTILEEGYRRNRRLAKEFESFDGAAFATAQGHTQNANRFKRAQWLGARLRDSGVKQVLGEELFQNAVERERKKFYQPEAVFIQSVFRGSQGRKKAAKKKESIVKIQKAYRKYTKK